MFNYCVELKVLKGLNNFNTNKVTTMNTTFEGCHELIFLDFSDAEVIT